MIGAVIRNASMLRDTLVHLGATAHRAGPRACRRTRVTRAPR
jgi:hypothetical protein